MFSTSRYTRNLHLATVSLFAATQLALSLGAASASAIARPNTNGKNEVGVAQSTAATTKHAQNSGHSAPASALPDNDAPVVAALLSEKSAPSSAQTPHKVTLCHRTASYQNPYVVVTVAVAAANQTTADHYGEHVGPVFVSSLPKHTEWGDIIPPLPGVHNGQNWTTAGRAIYHNGCKPIASPQAPHIDTAGATDRKVTLCHATGSARNPYVRITIAASGAYHAHLTHQDGRDIVPPFEFMGKTYAANWTPAGQATFRNNCGNAATPEQGGRGNGIPSDSGSILASHTVKDTQLANTGNAAVLLAVSTGALLIGLTGAAYRMSRKAS